MVAKTADNISRGCAIRPKCASRWPGAGFAALRASPRAVMPASMHLTYTIDPNLRLVTIDLGQEIPSPADIRQVFDDLSADPLFRPGYSVLVDGGHLYIERRLEQKGLLMLAARLALNSDVSRWAVLTSNLATYRDRRFAEAYAASLGIACRIFILRGEAMNWALGIAQLARSSG
jgi:hypothetical protein